MTDAVATADRARPVEDARPFALGDLDLRYRALESAAQFMDFGGRPQSRRNDHFGIVTGLVVGDREIQVAGRVRDQWLRRVPGLARKGAAPARTHRAGGAERGAHELPPRPRRDARDSPETIATAASSVPARTRATPSLGGLQTQDPHSGQTHLMLARPLSAVRWSVAKEIVTAWIITIPAAGLIAALCYLAVGLFG